MGLMANLVVLACVIVALVASIEIYMIVRARSIALLIGAWGYMLAWRITITIDQHDGKIGWFQSHSAWFLIIFYLLVSAGMLTLMYSLRNPLNRKREDHEEKK